MKGNDFNDLELESHMACIVIFIDFIIENEQQILEIGAYKLRPILVPRTNFSLWTKFRLSPWAKI